MPETHYQTLGVSPNADPAAIRRAYRALAKMLHPDVSAAKDAVERFQAIQSAYEVLIDPERRRDYDRGLASRRPTRRPSGAHYSWDNIAAERPGAVSSPRQASRSELDDLYNTFFGPERPTGT
jgi:curved DNA-binding protein CbpA